MKKEKTNTINSVDRTLNVLLLLASEGKEMGISTIARNLNLHKSTVYRTLFTLEKRGFIVQNKENARYWLGAKMYAMGMAAGTNLPIKETLRPYAIELHNEFQERVNISVIDTDESDYPCLLTIHSEFDNKHVLRVIAPFGSINDCYSSAAGKCLLAHLPKLEERIQDMPLEKYTANTIQSIPELIEHLEEVRLNGFGVDDEELETGLTCVGVPILSVSGEVVAAVSLSGPTMRMKVDFEKKIQRLKAVAEKAQLKL